MGEGMFLFADQGEVWDFLLQKSLSIAIVENSIG